MAELDAGMNRFTLLLGNSVCLACVGITNEKAGIELLEFIQRYVKHIVITCVQSLLVLQFPLFAC